MHFAWFSQDVIATLVHFQNYSFVGKPKDCRLACPYTDRTRLCWLMAVLLWYDDVCSDVMGSGSIVVHESGSCGRGRSVVSQ